MTVPQLRRFLARLREQGVLRRSPDRVEMLSAKSNCLLAYATEQIVFVPPRMFCCGTCYTYVDGRVGSSCFVLHLSPSLPLSPLPCLLADDARVGRALVKSSAMASGGLCSGIAPSGERLPPEGLREGPPKSELQPAAPAEAPPPRHAPSPPPHLH